ncbi:Vacuolar protein sorting-associated protein 33A [Dirofilaria immitis]|nr:Vacuolar protein sorting-associated protein 33A [Dirofilaria immitis]
MGLMASNGFSVFLDYFMRPSDAITRRRIQCFERELEMFMLVIENATIAWERRRRIKIIVMNGSLAGAAMIDYLGDRDMEESINGMSIIDVLSEANERILFGALDAIDGPKVIAWDPTLIKQFNLVTTTEKLKEHKVVSMLQLDFTPRVPQTKHNHVVYILSTSNPTIINKLIAYLKHARSINDSRQHHAFIVPEASFMIRNTLKQNRETNSILKTLESLPLRLFPLYDDFLTLLMHDLPSKLLLDNDWTELQKCASAVRQLEVLVGYLPNLRCKGKWAAQIVEIVKKMRLQMNESKTVSKRNDFQISDIILIDRWIDPLTPLLMQLTYAGLVDEIFDIGATERSLERDLKNKAWIYVLFHLLLVFDDTQYMLQNLLNIKSKYVYYSGNIKMIRDLHIKDVGKEIAKMLGMLRDERAKLKENLPSDSLAESKIFVRRLLDMQGNEKHADTHTLIAERLMSFMRDDLRYSTFPKLAIGNDILQGEYGDRVIPQIENLILEAHDPLIVLRFIALQCLVAGGFKNATIAAYERLFIQSYGGYYISLWIKLQLTGLLWERSGKVKYDYAPFDFQTACHRMSCFVDEEHSAYGTTAYPYGGYIPLTVRYIEVGIRNSWRDWTTILSDDRPTINCSTYSIIFIIGGITQAELACLRKTHFSNKLLIHENITRKVEKLVVDMTRQLIVNASDEEDVEVEVKMLFGKFVSPKLQSFYKQEPLPNAKNFRFFSRHCYYNRQLDSSEISSVNHPYSSPVQQITTEEGATSTNEKSKRKESQQKVRNRSILLHFVDL